jgi:hypothetical protein
MLGLEASEDGEVRAGSIGAPSICVTVVAKKVSHTGIANWLFHTPLSCDVSREMCASK